MPWIESHCSLRDHPKLKRLSRILSIKQVEAIGHLHCLWWSVLEYAEDGNIAGWDAADLADAALWEGDPEAFVQALVDCGPADKPGFVDTTEDGKPESLHDWHEYAGKWIERRAADRERKRKADKATSAGIPEELRRNSAGGRQDSLVTLPNPTPPNPTVPLQLQGCENQAEASEWTGLTPIAAYERGSARPITSLDADLLLGLAVEYGDQAVVDAVKTAVGGGTWRGGTTYIEHILQRWETEGRGNKPRPLPEKKVDLIGPQPNTRYLGRNPSPGVL
ncbi:MAG: hypothetical protein ABIH46_11240 [Chloroflexota bacterium]